MERIGVSTDSPERPRSCPWWSCGIDGKKIDERLLGQSPAQTKENLSQIIETANKKGVRVLLTGMLAPPNMGEQFQAEFRAIYPELAAKYHITFLPFLLEGIAGHPELNQEDGIHPTAAAQRMIAEMLYPLLQPLADDMLSR